MENGCFIDDIEDEYKWCKMTMEFEYNQSII